MSANRKKALRLAAGLFVFVGLIGVFMIGTTAQDNSKRHHFSFSGKRDSYDRKEVISGVAVSGMQSEGRYTVLDEIWKPFFSVSPHYHASHSETFYIIAGEVEWTVGGEIHVMKAGDSVYIPPKTVHSVRVVGGKDLHTLMIYEPGGYEEHIVREQSYTEEQLKDPKILEDLRKLNDFNPVKKK